MTLIIRDFESHTRDYISYDIVVRNSKVSRILLDLTIKEAVDLGLVRQDLIKSLYLTDKGKHYAFQHKLVG